MNQQNSRILLANLARRVRQGRERRAWTRRDLALKSGLSLRFLADIESGRGNPSLRRLTDLAAALEIPVPTLLLPEPSPDGRHIALLGLRGAGKTTLGRSLARKLKRRFVELDARIEVAAGLSLSQIFEIHGETYFRRLEREALSGFVTEEVPAVLATGGGLVMEPETYRLLRAHCRTVWLRALPDDHYNRVLRQGDRRPMADNPQAMVELRSLLAVREPFYRRAELTVDTSTLSVVEATRQLTGQLAGETSS